MYDHLIAYALCSGSVFSWAVGAASGVCHFCFLNEVAGMRVNLIWVSQESIEQNLSATMVKDMTLPTLSDSPCLSPESTRL